jgi:phosphoserine phosphatase RsbU/P
MSEHDLQHDLNDLRRVLDISRSMAAVTELDELLALIVDRSMELLHAERATIFLYDAGANVLISRIAAGAEEIRFPADRGIAGAAIQTGQTVVVPDAYADERFNPDVDKRTGFHTRNILSVPLRNHESKLVGVLQILNRTPGDFTDYDVSLAETLGAQAGVALQRARLIEHYLAKQKMERAMQIARDIQQGLLPAAAPTVEGFEVAGMSDPADETGGDTYDFLAAGDGRWMVTVADASGHGIGPALVIAEARAMIRALGHWEGKVPDVLATVNRLLAVDLDGGRFVTCFLGLLDAAEQTLKFASAGHGPILLYTAATDTFQELAATGLPLGVLDDTEYDEVITHTFAPGDMAIVTTDGFFEASDHDGQEYGIGRMIECIRRDRDKPAAEILTTLRAEVSTFAAGQPQADDLTAVLIRKT